MKILIKLEVWLLVGYETWSDIYTVGLSLIGNLQASLAKSNLNRMSRAEVFPLAKISCIIV